MVKKISGSNDSSDLGNNKIDWVVSLAKAGVSIVPFAGGPIAEIIGQLIPGQRMDRLQKYIELIDLSIKKLPKEVVKELLDNELL